MKKLMSKRGQNIAEYGIMIAMVIGGVVVMQRYVSNRIAGAIQVQADNYVGATGGGSLPIDSTSHSESTSGLTMTTARTGTAASEGTGTSVIVAPE